MRWALVDRTANRVGTTPGVDAVATKSILVGLPSDSHTEFLQMLQEACADGLPRRLTITHSTNPMLVVDILPLKLEQVTDRPALVILYDASEFDKSRDRISKLARRNEAILRCSMDGFFVVDADCRFLEVNEAFCRMTGYSVDELMRMRITDLEVN
ncbi:MAG: PAS domain-containing protein, partial [Phycisphaerae bacterium]|nr:PAS domain-containing protein [Phycisphaerae bacterium]